MPNLQEMLGRAAHLAVPEEQRGTPRGVYMESVSYQCMRAGAEIALEEFQRRWGMATGSASPAFPVRVATASSLARDLLSELPGYTPDSPPGEPGQ